jgi:hypothetical protein
LGQKWPPQIPGRELKQKQKALKEFSFDERESETESEYYSCQNDSMMFYRLDSEGMPVQEGCCSVS